MADETAMPEGKKVCGTCNHMHNKPDGSCDCGCTVM